MLLIYMQIGFENAILHYETGKIWLRFEWHGQSFGDIQHKFIDK